MKIYTMPQYSPEYWEVKRGIPSASNFHRILTAKKAKFGAKAEAYACELIAEIACLNPPFFTERPGHTAAMRNGLDAEPEARRFYEFDRKVTVRQVGFVTTEDGRFGFSPDGLVGEEGGLELKCPELKAQFRYLRASAIPDNYKAQVHGPLALRLLDSTMRFKWWDFLSYSPGADKLLIRVEPDAYTEKLAVALERFHAMFTEIKEKLLGVST